MAIHPAPPTRTLRYWLALVATTARKEAGRKVRDVSTALDVDPSDIYRFENGSVKAPAGIDQYLVAYAKILEMQDPREFYDRALALWRAEGEAPIIEVASPPTERAKGAARKAAQRTKRSPRGSRRTPDTNENSEADG